jgi:hypothetical protein
LVTDAVRQTANQALDQLQGLLPVDDGTAATSTTTAAAAAPTVNGKLHIRVAGCSSRVDAAAVCWYDLRFSWSLPVEDRSGAAALSSVLDELYFSVSRRFNSFKQLCKQLDAAKIKHPPLPSTGTGTALLSAFGRGSAVDEEQKQRALSLPTWLNEVLTSLDDVGNLEVSYIPILLPPPPPS